MSLNDFELSLQMQIDEIEALQSIYGDAWKTDETSPSSYGIDIAENGKTVSLFLTLPETYPQHSPPVYTISAPSLSKLQKDEISRILNDEYLENIGCSVLYQWVEKIREYLLNSEITSSERIPDEKVVNTSETEKPDEIPAVIHGEIFTDRKSSFQGHLARVNSVQQVKQVIMYLKSNRKIANATHNIYAYRISLNNSSFIQDCDDDGETQAGGRILHLLQIVNVSDVLVMVSRWYGGIRLGPDRFRHINNSVRQVLTTANLIFPKKTAQQ